jgi:hypothetical protein
MQVEEEGFKSHCRRNSVLICPDWLRLLQVPHILQLSTTRTVLGLVAANDGESVCYKLLFVSQVPWFHISVCKS